MAIKFVQLFFEDSDKSLKFTQKTAIGSALFLTLVTAVTGLYYGGPDAKKYVASIVALGITFIVDRVSKYESDNKLEKEFLKLMRNEKNLEYLGDTEAGVMWFLKHSKELTLARNTVFSRTNVNTHPWISELDPRIQRAMKETIEYKCSWTDIYIKDEEKSVLDLHNSIKYEFRERHRMILVNTELPMLQVLILRYRSNEDTAVLLGWNFIQSDKSIVYITKDRGAYDYFCDYFDRLASGGVRRPASMPLPGQSVSKPSVT